MLTQGLADAVAVGRPFLANPDLVRRRREGLPLNTDRPDLYYGGDPTGRTDFPTVDA
ncbi:hypothetical protein AB0F77_22800 [Streptomyces sp. NPDC026672]|uniref:hypothetical protein n=1 Tax=unclassified Streptomyces TaxID=2593676 RepID=UPI003404A0BB